MKHRLLLILYGLIGAGVLFGIVMGAMYAIAEYDKPAKDITATAADYSISAAELFAAFETNEKKATEKYLNKIIEVKGPVGEVTIDQDKNELVVLRTPEMMFGIVCAMLPGESEKVKKLTTDQQVTIKGLCTGYTMDVVLTNGSLVE